MNGRISHGEHHRAPRSSPVRWGWHWRLIIGTLLVLGCLAMTIRYRGEELCPRHTDDRLRANRDGIRVRRARPSSGTQAFLALPYAILAGLILLAQPKLALGSTVLVAGTCRFSSTGSA